MTFDELQQALKTKAEAEKAKGAQMFMGKPDRWYEAYLRRCPNDHVSRMTLKTEVKGDVCLACYEPVLLTFPEDEEGPLARVVDDYSGVHLRRDIELLLDE